MSAATQAAEPVNLRRADNNERFVAFAFAAADIVVEIDAGETVTFAAGAFHSKFGRPPDAFIGRAVRDLVAPADHEALDAALFLLTERGRLLPIIVRMSDPDRTRLSLSGLVLRPAGRPLRLCLTFARLPEPATSAMRSSTPSRLARAAEAKMRAGTSSSLGLLEVVGRTGGLAVTSSDVIGEALETLAPDAVVSEIAPGRFGLLGDVAGMESDLLRITSLLETALRTRGVDVAVAARHLPLAADGLTPTQAARALRQALDVFARAGAAGVSEAGFEGGIAGYIRRAAARAGSLRQAIRAGSFNLAFQPIVSLAGRSPHHYEALIRPKPIPGCPFAGPQEFVTLVEALELAEELDLAVAKLACEAASMAGAAVAFNISGQSVQSPVFRDRLLHLLAESPARQAGLILVEMTETAEIEDVAEARLTADGLRALGVPFCLDDFGAGAADMRLLRALTADVVKLDGSYVPGVVQVGRERAFVAGMIEVARAGGAEIVAERVETDAEADALRQLGVQYGQGWLFGKPGPLPHGAGGGDAYRGPVGRRTGEKETWG